MLALLQLHHARDLSGTLVGCVQYNLVSYLWSSLLSWHARDTQISHS